MKHLLLLVIAFSLLSCTKEELHGPNQLKNGQVVELLVNHNYASTEDILLQLPNKVPAGASLMGFEERQPGYSYRVKARFVFTENPPQDGSAYWFEFMDILDKNQYTGHDAFQLELIQSHVPGGPTLLLNKKGNDYFFKSEKVQLTPANETIKAQLEEIWQHAQSLRENPGQAQLPKWKSIKANVSHDKQYFGKAYLVQNIHFEQ
ncbi:hypothetical protein [Pedobacter sp.]|uniref:hypothetical protein n=1 Tax=Pedobacter sp. TaxID=1411316 RepID=UPI003D7F6F1C